MASAAEARIRVKAEAMLRQHFPTARIIHEFDLGPVRLDMAAVTEDRLVLVEIKSERDRLTRLERQVRAALSIGGPVLICFAPKWREAVKTMQRAGALYRAEWLEESSDGFSGVRPAMLADHHDRYDSRALMGLLLKFELLALAKPFGARTRNTVPEIHRLVHENLTGREIRRGAMAALRARRFGWVCDEPFQREAA